VKKAYYDMQKICHPDVAGEDGEEMCILLNDAYDVLASEVGRADYNEQLRLRAPVPDHLALAQREQQEVQQDTGPTWKWAPKRHKKRPQWNGTPMSRSTWHKVPEDGRGEKHEQQMFAFVDEWNCICCRNCCDVAPRTFCIDAESGRARVYTQWGDDEEHLKYALMACPVDCISWVSREHLQRLEYVTAETMYEDGAASLPNPMAIRQGTFNGEVKDPFQMAKEFQAKKRADEERAKASGGFLAVADMFAGRIGQVLARLTPKLRSRLQEAWGS